MTTNHIHFLSQAAAQKNIGGERTSNKTKHFQVLSLFSVTEAL